MISCTICCYHYSMKKNLFVSFVLFTVIQSQAQSFDVKDKRFSEVFTFMYKSAGHYFSEIKANPIISTMFKEPDTIGYRLKLLPPGVTDWKHISMGIEHELTIFFKLGDYSKDSAEVAARFNDMIALIKETDPAAVFREDDSYSDTKIRELYICAGNSKDCGENHKWRVSLYFHKMFGDEYNVSVNLQSYRE